MSFYGTMTPETVRSHSRASRHLQTPVGDVQDQFDERGQLITIVTPGDADSVYKDDLPNGNVEAKTESDKNEEEEEKKPRMTRRQLLTVICMAIANFSVSACFGILAPFFPQEAASKGVNATTVGLIFGGFELVIFITSPIFGALLTKIGARFMFISGLFLGAGCVTLFGFLDLAPDGAVYIAMCFICRSLEAIGCSMFVTASFAIIASEFPGQVATYIGFLETFSGIGMMASPAIGGVLYDAGGYKLPFIVMGALMFLTTIVTFFLLPKDTEDKQPFSGSMLKLIRIPSILIVCALITVSCVALGFMDPTMAQHIDDISHTKVSSSIKGVIFLIGPGVYGLSAPFLGAINDKFGFTKTMMVVGLLMMSVAQFFMGPAPFAVPPNPNESQLWILIVALVPLGLGVGLTLLPTFQECLTRAVANGFEEGLDLYGLVSGIFNSCFSLGAFLGPTLGGLMQQELGYPWASTCLSFILGGMGVITIVFYACFAKFNKDGAILLSQGSVDERQTLLGEGKSNDRPLPNGSTSPIIF